jgi:hypothetical protein
MGCGDGSRAVPWSAEVTRALRRTCPSCGSPPGNLCRARGGEDAGSRLMDPHPDRPDTPVGKTGRPRVLNEHDIAHAQTLQSAGVPVSEIADGLGVSRATIYRYLGKP